MDELLSLKQAAELLQISEKSLLKLLAEEQVPARKVAGKWRFGKEALIHWVSAGNSQDYTRNIIEEEDISD